MSTQQRLTFNVNPGTLTVAGHDYQGFHELYYEYKDQLMPFCDEMQHVRRSMLDRGYTGDFSDREAELLYLLIRETQPSVVVEISPGHGYSTNYILAALTHNNKGELHSYEICEKVNGIPITGVILSNLAASVDKSRLELVVGDARQAAIPDHEFLFIDSNHEAWFASWYFSQLVGIPRIVFAHDVLIRPRNIQSVLPKGTFLGIREQYYALQALHVSQHSIFSVADFAFHMDQALRSSIPIRYGKDYTDRSVVFVGHRQNALSMEMHHAMQDIQKARLQSLIGNRIAALECYDKYSEDRYPLFVRLYASSILPLLGFRYPAFADKFKDITIDHVGLTVSELVAALELAVTSANMRQLRELLISAARQSRIDRQARDYILRGYRHIPVGNSAYHDFRRLAGRVYHKLRSL